MKYVLKIKQKFRKCHKISFLIKHLSILYFSIKYLFKIKHFMENATKNNI